MLKPIVLFITGLLLMNTVISGQHKVESIQECKQKELYLIIQYSHKATLEKLDSQTYKLTLKDVSPYATTFTQRPIRKVELITLDKLIHLWGNGDPNGFTNNPPNAAINAFVEGSGSEDHTNFLVQLLYPVYDAKKMTLTYVVKALDGNPIAIPDYAILGHVNLFIDDICLNCWWPK